MALFEAVRAVILRGGIDWNGLGGGGGSANNKGSASKGNEKEVKPKMSQFTSSRPFQQVY
jgi:hypothetical protein